MGKKEKYEKKKVKQIRVKAAQAQERKKKASTACAKAEAASRSVRSKYSRLQKRFARWKHKAAIRKENVQKKKKAMNIWRSLKKVTGRAKNRGMRSLSARKVKVRLKKVFIKPTARRRVRAGFNKSRRRLSGHKKKVSSATSLAKMILGKKKVSTKKQLSAKKEREQKKKKKKPFTPQRKVTPQIHPLLKFAKERKAKAWKRKLPDAREKKHKALKKLKKAFEAKAKTLAKIVAKK